VNLGGLGTFEIGFELGLFFRTVKSSFFLQSFVISELTFIWAFRRLALIGFVLGLYWVCIGFVFSNSPLPFIFIIRCII